MRQESQHYIKACSTDTNISTNTSISTSLIHTLHSLERRDRNKRQTGEKTSQTMTLQILHLH